MVLFKRSALALAFACTSISSAKADDFPSLKELIFEIPIRKVRIKIEDSYRAGNFDEVEHRLISFLDDNGVNLGNSDQDGIQETKENVKSMIHKRVEETKAAAFKDNVSDGQSDGTEGSSEDDPVDITAVTLADIVNSMPEGAAKKKIQEDMEKGELDMTRGDLDVFVENYISDKAPDLSNEQVEAVKEMLHSKINDFFGIKEVPQLMEEETNENEPVDIITMTLEDIVNSMPEGAAKKQIQEDMKDGKLDMTRSDLDAFLEEFVRGQAPDLSNEQVEIIKDTFHGKINDFFGVQDEEEVPQLLEEEPNKNEPVDVSTMTLVDIVNSMPEGAAKKQIQEHMEDGELDMTRNDLDSFLEEFVRGQAPDLSDEQVEIIKDMFHSKIDDFFGAQEEVPQLMEEESNIVETLKDIETSQKMISDLLKELEDGL